MKGFVFAFNGWRIFFKTQLNAKFHAIIGILVIFLGCIFQISKFEWAFIFISIGLVLITEMINTAIEFLCNFITLKDNLEIKQIKDISAGAVLISALVAITIGLLIFIPYFTGLISTIL